MADTHAREAILHSLKADTHSREADTHSREPDTHTRVIQRDSDEVDRRDTHEAVKKTEIVKTPEI